MELLRKLAEFAQTHRMLPPGGTILTAVSGGADSVCLLAALLELSETGGFSAGIRGFSVAAVHYNHMLRGSQSDGDAAFVARLCEKLGVALSASSGDVRQFSTERRIGIEEAARRMRYDYFHRAAAELRADRIATAHTADDNAETVLLNLTRGAGLKGLGGIPPKRGIIIRPMLTVTRREVLSFLSSRSLEYVEDASNSLDIYRRNRIRHHIIPVLTEINPKFAESVAVSSALLREDEDYLNGLARDFIDAVQTYPRSLDARALFDLPRPVAGRVIRLMAGGHLTARHISDVLALCASDNPSGMLSLPGAAVRRVYDRVIFEGRSAPGTFAPVDLEAGETAVIPELGLAVSCRKLTCDLSVLEKINKTFNTFLFKYDNVCGKIVIRPRETGDKITLFGGAGSKSLKKLFIEKRIPAYDRAKIPVIADEAGVLAVRGIAVASRAAIDKRASCGPGDSALEIEFKETANWHEK